MKRIRLFKFAMASLALVTVLSGYNTSGWQWPMGVTVPYYLRDIIPQDVQDAIERGFEPWNNVSTADIGFLYLGTTSDPPVIPPNSQNLVCFVGSGWENVSPNTNLIAATITYELNGVTQETDLYYNDQWWNFSTNGAYHTFDIQDVAAHEAGHWVGLDENPDHPLATMNNDMYYNETFRRDLHSDDIAGASFLYPYPPDWPDLDAIYIDSYHHLGIDVAMAWDPTEKDEYLHLACKEGLYPTAYENNDPPVDTFSPLDSIIWPVRVVYAHNDLVGWSLKESLSGYHDVIFGPQLEIDENDNQHIIWAENDATIGEVIYRKREHGSWGSEYTLSDGVVDWPRYPTIAVKHAPSQVSPHSDMVYAAWVEKVDDRYVLKFRRSTSGGSNWDYSIYQLAQSDIGGWIANPDLAIDSTGGVHIVWAEEGEYGDRYLCWIKNTNLGSSAYWTDKASQPHSIAGTPSVAIDGYGYVHIAYSVPDTGEFRIYYDRITDLGEGLWQEMGAVSPANVRAERPHVVCDNLGFVHFFWDDNRHHYHSLQKDIFHARNIHMGDGQIDYWYPGFGAMIYQYPVYSEVVWLGDASKPDTFGDIFVGIDVYRQTGSNWDIYTTLGRQDDGVRELPWPPGQMASASSMSTEEEDSLDIEPQGCYLSASLNRLFYFAPAEAQLSCYSVDGRRVHQQEIKGSGELEVDFLPSGTYFAHLKSTDGSSSRIRVVVIHQ